MADSPTAPIVAGSLIVGYLVARESGVRPLGGAVLVTAAGWCARSWARRTGPVTAAVLLGIYTAGFVGSHRLAKRIGAWPAVLTVAALSGASAWVLADRETAAAT